MRKGCLRGLLSFIVFILLSLIYLDQKRTFYPNSDKSKVITVWKRLGGKCYIIPYKYYGITSPSDDYILVPITIAPTGLIFDDKNGVNKVIVNTYQDNYKIVNTNKKEFLIINSKDNQKEFDSIYTYKEGNQSLYKDDVDFISINVKENYATDRNGKIE